MEIINHRGINYRIVKHPYDEIFFVEREYPYFIFWTKWYRLIRYWDMDGEPAGYWEFFSTEDAIIFIKSRKAYRI